jgi:hypothetical protein
MLLSELGKNQAGEMELYSRTLEFKMSSVVHIK